MTIASSSGGADSFSIPGFWKYLYGLSRTWTATSALAVLIGLRDLPFMRLDSCMAAHRSGNRSGQHFARVTSSVTMMRNVSARSLSTGPFVGATTSARSTATRRVSRSPGTSWFGQRVRAKFLRNAAAGTATALVSGFGSEACATRTRSAAPNPGASEAARSRASAAAMRDASAAVVSRRKCASCCTVSSAIAPGGEEGG